MSNSKKLRAPSAICRRSQMWRFAPCAWLRAPSGTSESLTSRFGATRRSQRGSFDWPTLPSLVHGPRSARSTVRSTLVGITRVRSVLLAAALEGLHESKHSNFKDKILWDHALAAGCISQHVALAHSQSDSEEAFMAGLLHDIGRPILDQILGDQYDEVIALVKDGAAASLLSAEQRVFRFDHTDIGFVAVTGLGFPLAIAEAIRFHHDPTMAETDRPLCATVSLANSMCAKAELGPDTQPDLDLATLPSTEILGLATRVDELWEQVPRVVQQASGR